MTPFDGTAAARGPADLPGLAPSLPESHRSVKIRAGATRWNVSTESPT